MRHASDVIDHGVPALAGAVFPSLLSPEHVADMATTVLGAVLSWLAVRLLAAAMKRVFGWPRDGR